MPRFLEMPAESSRPTPWYREIAPDAWRAVLAAFLGWALDAMDFVIYLMAIPALEKEFGFDSVFSGLLATVALLSSAVGGIFFGWLADRLGRTRALSLTVLVYSFASLGTATAQDMTQLVFWRTLLGLGMGGEWSAGAALVSESVPAAHRGKAIGLMQSGWALGYIAAALLAATILPALGWRPLFAAGVTPALLVFWIRRRLKEPQVWSNRQEGSGPRSLSLLFSPAQLPMTLRATFLSAAVMFGYWGLFSWLPAFLASPPAKGGAGLTMLKTAAWIVPMQLGAFAGYLTFGFLSDRFGRRPSVAGFLTGAAILVPFYGLLARSPLLLLVLGPLLGFFGHGYFSVFGALLAELFPTSIRATAQGLCYNAGRALSALAPLTIGVLATRHGIGPALTATSAFFLIGAGAVFLLPETRGRKLDAGEPG
ncbi:MAG: MFS transporter [Thermoanaerobaculia bacterium]|nr:MFS transporter [Thermoanaerobaculia bacterium]